jgi:FkbM family methyltransferase
MNPVLRFLEFSVEAFARSRIWRAECEVWNQRMLSATFDRWLYLRLHSLGLMGRDERTTLSRIVKPGMTVVDVGSNLGLYTVLLSRLVGPAGHVLSFEPDPDLFSLLQQSSRLNCCQNLTAHNLALGSNHGRLTLQTTVINAGDNYLGEGRSRIFRRSIETRVAPFDELVLDRVPDFVKIDVQGWELEVLRGMTRVLESNSGIKVVFEYWPEGLRRAGFMADDIIGFFKKRNFQLYIAKTGERFDSVKCSEYTRRLKGVGYIDICATRESCS